MKILLIGPFPPPHGGVSVHVAGIEKDLSAAGIPCRILNTDRINWPGFLSELVGSALRGWTLHLHTNGHNRNSWLLALICGLAGRSPAGSVLTLHSGIVPAYLAPAFSWRRRLARLAASLYSRVICVNDEIRDALISSGVAASRIEVVPAWLGHARPNMSAVSLGGPVIAWIDRHRPLLSATVFFRPEYGFDLVVAAMARMRAKYPSMGCVVMGSGENRTLAERQIRDAAIADSILLLGDVDHATCLAVMARSDVFIRPTLRDGDSVSVREALALGTPVVASRTGTRPAGANLFSPGNLDELLWSIDTALSSEAQQTADAIPAGCMNRLVEIYGQVVGEMTYASA